MPDGSAESFTSDIKWIGCNLDYAPQQWASARQRAASLGIRTIPWKRLAHVNQGETWEHVKERLALLVTTAQAWGENLIIPNLEDEASSFSPRSCVDHLRGPLDWDGQTAWSTLAWLQNGVNWRPLAETDDAVLLQIFPRDNHWAVGEIAQKMGDCVAHAREMGLTYVGVTYQTFGEGVEKAQPSWFNVTDYMHSTFPGNRIGHGEWGNWYA